MVTVELRDQKGRFVPDACNMLRFTLEGNGRILGAGNGDPQYMGEDHPKDEDCRAFCIPAFNGLAQVLIQSSQEPSVLRLTANSDGLENRSHTHYYKIILIGNYRKTGQVKNGCNSPDFVNASP